MNTGPAHVWPVLQPLIKRAKMRRRAPRLVVAVLLSRLGVVIEVSRFNALQQLGSLVQPVGFDPVSDGPVDNGRNHADLYGQCHAELVRIFAKAVRWDRPVNVASANFTPSAGHERGHLLAWMGEHLESPPNLITPHVGVFLTQLGQGQTEPLRARLLADIADVLKEDGRI